MNDDREPAIRRQRLRQHTRLLRVEFIANMQHNDPHRRAGANSR